MKKPAKKSKLRPGLAKAVKSRKADRRQNPSARVAHRASKPKVRRKRAPKAQPPAPREVGLLDAIGEVLADVTDLGQEMRDWADNMPESKQGGDKHSEVEQAADTLEEAANNDPADEKTMLFLNEIKITIRDPAPRRRGYSRSARLGQAVDVLGDVINKLQEFETKDKGQQTIADELRSDLDDMEGNLQGVDFPGMYG